LEVVFWSTSRGDGVSRLDLLRLSPKHQAFIRKQERSRDTFKKPKLPPPTAFGEEFDSKLEAEFASVLEQWRSDGRIIEWRYHPLRFRIAHNCSYEPDFATWEELNGFPRTAVYEVKGSWKMKNARDTRTRLLIACALFPYFTWYGVTREADEWHYEQINPQKEGSSD
jgi:hypothetical protein